MPGTRDEPVEAGSLVPDVSVIVPTSDRADRLGRTLRSVLLQREVDLELVVVDDGSTDGTGQLLSRIDDSRVRVMRNAAPLGESGARNRGIAESRGRWIAFLDDDDLWAPDKLSRQLDALATTGRVWAYAGDVLVDEDLHVLQGEPPPSPDVVAASLPRYNSVPAGASNVVVESRILSQVGPFDQGLRRTADWDMWLRLLQVGLPAWAPSPLVANCVHPGNMSRDMGLLFKELDVIAERHGIGVDRARHCRWAAWSALLDHRRGRAVAYYAKAVSEGDLRSVGRLLLALLRPGVAVRGSRGLRPSAVENPWIREARAWLEASAQAAKPWPP
jgi:glycosyltransferase involved in cell wall biosynthesis